MELDLQNLMFWFNNTETLFSYFKKYRLGDSDDNRRLFFNNNGKILLVAHIDTVQEPIIYSISRRNIYAAGLDDRLGCAMAYQLMRELDCDLLVCDLEESCDSTAQYHSVGDYNFILELDRKGLDFVDYDGLAEPGMITDFTACTGRKLGNGLFSDICHLDTDIGCLNIGIGYHNAHALDSHVKKSHINRTFRDIIRFCREYGNRSYKIGNGVRLIPEDGPEQPIEDYDKCSVCGMWSIGNHMGVCLTCANSFIKDYNNNNTACKYSCEYDRDYDSIEDYYKCSVCGKYNDNEGMWSIGNHMGVCLTCANSFIKDYNNNNTACNNNNESNEDNEDNEDSGKYEYYSEDNADHYQKLSDQQKG